MQNLHDLPPPRVGSDWRAGVVSAGGLKRGKGEVGVEIREITQYPPVEFGVLWIQIY